MEGQNHSTEAPEAPALPTQHPRCEKLQVLRIRGTRSAGTYKYETIVLRKAQAASSRPGASAEQPHLPLRLLLCAALIIVRVGKIKGFRGRCQGPGCCLPALCVTHARQSRPLSATCPSRQCHPDWADGTARYDGLSSLVPAGPGGGRDSDAGSGQGNWGPVKGKDLSTAPQRSTVLGPPREPSPWRDPVLLARSPEDLTPGQFPICKQPRSVADLATRAPPLQALRTQPPPAHSWVPTLLPSGWSRRLQDVAHAVPAPKEPHWGRGGAQTRKETPRHQAGSGNARAAIPIQQCWGSGRVDASVERPPGRAFPSPSLSFLPSNCGEWEPLALQAQSET